MATPWFSPPGVHTTSGEYQYFYTFHPYAAYIRHQSEPYWHQLTHPSLHADVRHSPDGKAWYFEGPYTWLLEDGGFQIVNIDWNAFFSKADPWFGEWIAQSGAEGHEMSRTDSGIGNGGPSHGGQHDPHFRQRIERWTQEREMQMHRMAEVDDRGYESDSTVTPTAPTNGKQHLDFRDPVDGLNQQRDTQIPRTMESNNGYFHTEATATYSLRTNDKQHHPDYQQRIEGWTQEREAQIQRLEEVRDEPYDAGSSAASAAFPSNDQHHPFPQAQVEGWLQQSPNGPPNDGSIHLASGYEVQATGPHERPPPVNLYLVLDTHSPDSDRWTFALALGPQPCPLPSILDDDDDPVAMCGAYLDFMTENQLHREWFKIAYVLASDLSMREQQVFEVIGRLVASHLAADGVEGRSYDQWMDEWTVGVVDGCVQNGLLEERWVWVVERLVGRWRQDEDEA